jgi:nucleoside-diphosphate-sugar epimerase
VKSALVGHTGFVGSNLKTQFSFTDFYNSANSRQLNGKNYDLVVFSAARAEKWKANAEPGKDKIHIAQLQDLVEKVHAREFILISTVDVYADPVSVDESYPIDPAAGSAYGRHRYELERCVREFHKEALIVRLPALFGRGLKKNALYDFLNNNQIERLDSRAKFQFYNLNHLWADLLIARKNSLRLLNICSSPISLGDIHQNIFGIPYRNELSTQPAAYDVRSVHSKLWARQGPYLYEEKQTMDEIKEFAALSRPEKVR